MSETVKWPQYVAGLSAAGGAFAVGTALGWSAPAGPRLVDEKQYFEISLYQFDWVASILTLGCAISCLPIGFLMKKFGRKWTMISLVVPFMLGWGLMIWAQNFAMMLLGRLIIGIAGGAFCISAPQYSAEIAEKEIRGSIGSFFELLANAGILFVYLIGPYMSVFWMNIVCAMWPLLFGVIFFFMPESPVYLIIENRDDEAIKSLKWLRGSSYDPRNEIEELQRELRETENEKLSLKEAFEKRSAFKALRIGFGAMFFQQMSGINVVVFYATIIFSAAQTGIDSDVSTIIVGAVMLLATFIATILVDRAGRKVLLLISATTMMIMLAALGAFFYIQDTDEETAKTIGWLPLTSLCIYIFAFSVGFAPVPWILASEVYSKEMSPIASPLSGAFSWGLAFVLTVTFNSVSEAIGIGQTFWIFAGFSALGGIFVLLMVPETKGKSMSEIQRMLSGEKAIK